MRRLRYLAALIMVCLSCTPQRVHQDKQSSPPHPSAAIVTIATPSASVATSPPLPPRQQSSSRLGHADEARLDAAVHRGIERGDVPGAVLVVIRNREVVLRKAYGLRAKEPANAAMSIDTIFDLASLTKPIATASCILVLVHHGVLRLSDPVQKWLPAFHGDGREIVTIEQLLTHTSGLPAGNARADHATDPTRAMSYVVQTPLENQPGSAYLYSDLGYVLLGAIVEKASGMTLDEFAKKNVFEPLGMRDTFFRPSPELRPRIAPTTRIGDEILHGRVHDPMARALSAVAGHAGLFSTADDVARFVSMLLGTVPDKPILSNSLLQAMLDLHPVGSKSDKRSLALGSLFDSVGHTGFTGTAFWLDAMRGNAVILLTSALHPDNKGSAKQLRREVATAATLIGTRPGDSE